jgi:hypothetical protein
VRLRGRTDLHCDRYLQRKWLQEREKHFLNWLKVAGEKVLALLHCIFLKEEPIISSMLTKEMQRYACLSSRTYDSLSPPDYAAVDMAQVTAELGALLAELIPSAWGIRSSQAGHHEDCDGLICQLSQHFQSQLYLPSLTLDPSLVLFQAPARWLPAQEQQAGSSSERGQAGKENRLGSV